MNEEPTISVVMPVYNGERFLSDAIGSVLSQTYQNFELIIIDDGSTDGTVKIVNSFGDPRIRLIRLKRSGVSSARNKGVSMARSELIAMHDADDISLPTRLEKQFSFLKTHPEVGLLGTNLQVIDSEGRNRFIISLLTNPDDIKLGEVFSNQIGQGTVLVRKSIIEKAGLYNTRMAYAEDADLWRRINRVTKIANLKEPLYKYRTHGGGASQREDLIFESAMKTAFREFEYYLDHKEEFRFFSFHPFSMYGGLKSYLERKCALYSRMSWMYGRYGYRRYGLPVILLAILHAPWVNDTYSQLSAMLRGREAILNFKYKLY